MTLSKRVKRKKTCADCGKMVEVEEIPGVFTYDLVFCSEDCSKTFWKRDKKVRKERGLPPLREVG